jgi:CTP synthase
VTELRSRGIQPDVIVCRSDQPITDGLKRKISLLCDVPAQAVVSAVDAPSIYEIPLAMHEEGLDMVVMDTLRIDPTEHPIDLQEWESLVEHVESLQETVRIGIIGKYVNLPDAYLSIVEALRHAGFENRAAVEFDWVDAEMVPGEYGSEYLRQLDGIVIPGGFGERGIEGMIAAAKIAREEKIPLLGICLGMQVMVVESARNVAGLEGANSTEFDRLSPHPVIDLMAEQADISDLGGTMRLGAYPAMLSSGSRVAELYGSEVVSERHRHRYEFNSRYRTKMEDAGLICSGASPDGRLVEFVERADHPYFVGTQAHPEFKSRPDRPHPLFRGLLQGARQRREGREPRLLDLDAVH